MNTLKLFVGAYLAVAVLTLVVIFLLRGDTAAVNDAVWVRGAIVVVSAALMFLFTLLAAVMVAAIVVIVALPDSFPLWMKIDQVVCGLVLVGVNVLVNGPHLRRAMEAGAVGFVVKDAPAEALADAIRRVVAGERVVDPALAVATLAAGESPLTARERDVLVAARSGVAVAEIAATLFLSEGTVRNYLSAAITKTATRNRVEAVRVADENGWL